MWTLVKWSCSRQSLPQKSDFRQTVCFPNVSRPLFFTSIFIESNNGIGWGIYESDFLASPETRNFWWQWFQIPGKPVVFSLFDSEFPGKITTSRKFLHPGYRRRLHQRQSEEFKCVTLYVHCTYSTCFFGPLCNNQIRTQIYRPNRIQIQTGTGFSFETLVRTSTTPMCCLQSTVNNLRWFFGHCPRYICLGQWGILVVGIWNILGKFAENLHC